MSFVWLQELLWPPHSEAAEGEQSCSRQQSTAVMEELVDRACVLTVGEVVLLGEGELEHQQTVVQQVEEEERGQNQLGQCELSPGQTGDEVGSVGDDGEEDEQGEEDDPDHAGVEVVVHVDAEAAVVLLAAGHAGAVAGGGAAVPAGRQPDCSLLIRLSRHRQTPLELQLQSVLSPPQTDGWLGRPD